MHTYKLFGWNPWQVVFREESWHEFFELVGIGESGLSDVSENKHKYLAEALKDER